MNISTDHKNFHDAGRVNLFFYFIGVFILKLLGWGVEGRPPRVPKYVVIIAPHTSYWDYPIALFISWCYGIQGAWLGKAEMFRWPLLGWFFRKTGGIPVDRSLPAGLVDQAVQVFASRERLLLGIAPEGTRARRDYWKSGFYYIALKANVPIALGFLDFRRKRGGFGPLYYPTGNIETDLDFIRNYFDTITPRHPERRSPVAFRDRTSRPQASAEQTCLTA